MLVIGEPLHGVGLQELFGGLRKRDEPELLETVLGDALPANLDRVAAVPGKPASGVGEIAGLGEAEIGQRARASSRELCRRSDSGTSIAYSRGA